MRKSENQHVNTFPNADNVKKIFTNNDLSKEKRTRILKKIYTVKSPLIKKYNKLIFNRDFLYEDRI